MAKARSLDEQEGLLKYKYPKATTWHRLIDGKRSLWCQLHLRPCPMCDEYLVTLAYEPSLRPHVWITEPKIVKEAHGIRTPHLNYDDTLCLYDPAKNEWTPAEALVYTIVPWTSRWLFHYENWLALGTWQGDSDANDLSVPKVATSNLIMEGPNA